MIRIEVNEGKLPWVVGIGAILVGILVCILGVLYPGTSAKSDMIANLVIMLMILAGIFLCMDGRNRKLTVEDMKICYSNWLGRKKNFSLDEIGYCRTAFGKEHGNTNYLILYDLQGDKLCKLEYNMKNSILFLQYLLDNKVRVECSERSDSFLRSMIHTASICQEEIPAAVNNVYEEIRKITWEWLQMNKKFGAEWRTGITAYLEEDLVEGKQIWEQRGCQDIGFFAGADGNEAAPGRTGTDALPEGYLIVIEGYLLKDGKYVISKINQAVSIAAPVIRVSKSMQVGEEYRIRLFSDAAEEWSEQLAFMSHELPRNRFHTEELVFAHELRERIP